jgi:hypothetical protein
MNLCSKNFNFSEAKEKQEKLKSEIKEHKRLALAAVIKFSLYFVV